MSDKPEDTVWDVPANTISGDEPADVRRVGTLISTGEVTTNWEREPADVRRDLERIVKATRGEPAALVAQPTPRLYSHPLSGPVHRLLRETAIEIVEEWQKAHTISSRSMDRLITAIVYTRPPSEAPATEDDALTPTEKP